MSESCDRAGEEGSVQVGRETILSVERRYRIQVKLKAELEKKRG